MGQLRFFAKSKTNLKPATSFNNCNMWQSRVQQFNVASPCQHVMNLVLYITINKENTWWVCLHTSVSFSRPVSKGREASQWSWQNNSLQRPAREQSAEKHCVCVCTCVYARWNREYFCVHVLPNKNTCLKGKSCGPVHATSPCKFCLQTGHRNRGGLSSRPQSSLSDRACEPDVWCDDGGWKTWL